MSPRDRDHQRPRCDLKIVPDIFRLVIEFLSKPLRVDRQDAQASVVAEVCPKLGREPGDEIDPVIRAGLGKIPGCELTSLFSFNAAVPRAFYFKDRGRTVVRGCLP